MKIYDGNNLLLDVISGNTIIIDSQKLFFDFYNLKSCYQTIVYNLLKICHRDTQLEVRNFENNDLDILALLGLTELGCSFIYNAKVFELSFAYAVPLNRDNFLKTYTINNLDACLKNGQIVFLPSDSLYIVDHIEEDAIKLIHRKEKRTIKKNLETIISHANFTQDFFDFWKRYDFNRYGETQTDAFIRFFKNVYSSASFELYEYIYDNEIVAYNVCYLSQNQKVIYDVLFPWEKSNNVYRIGIYSMIKNIEKAFSMGWGYSICYGKFDYKDSIFKLLKRL